MSNRQARRQQSREARSSAPSRPGAPRRSGGGGSPNSFVSPRFLLGAGVVVVALIAVLVTVSLLNSGGDEGLAEDIRAVEIPRDMVDGATMGSDDAPIKLTMFEDFQCPFCLRFTGEDEPTIIDEYVKTGDVQIEYRHFPILRGESVDAAIASECAADQNLFWEYHKALFAKQADEGQATNEELDVGRFSTEALGDLADEAGLDRDEFDACMSSGEHVESIDEDEAAAREAGLSGTPNFLISVNGSSPQPLPPSGGDPGGPDQWRALFDGILGLANATPTTSGEAAGTATAGPTGEADETATPRATATP